MAGRPGRGSKALLALGALGLLGLAAYVGLRDHAFRNAALDLRLSRAESLRLSEAFLRELGHGVDGHTSAAAFWTSQDPLIYLEKNLGTQEANRILREERPPIWGWRTRFFRPLEKEEYSVWWGPDRRLVAYQHDILDEKALPSLERPAALALADAFFRARLPEEHARYELVEQSSDERPNRRDHRFLWRAPAAPLASRLEVSAVVSGNEVTWLGRSLVVPEAFERAERAVASRRTLLANVASLADFALTLGLLLFVWHAWRRRWLRWKPALVLAGALGAATCVGIANGLPGAFLGYDTEDTLGAFWVGALALPLLGAAVASALQVPGFAATDAAGRLGPSGGYSLGDIVREPFLRSSTFVSATLAGFAAAGVQLGFIVLYYLAGRRFLGMYAPLDVPYDDLLSTAAPWIQPLLVGLGAALREESVYRLFAVSLLLRFTRRAWLAVLLPAVLWGFLHTGYYVEPICARGLELTIVGVFLGAVFLRFGIWATIVSHYVYNATVSSTLLLGSGNRYFQVSAVVVIGLLGVPLLWSLLRMRGRAGREPFAGEPLAWRQGAVPPVVPAAPVERALRLRTPRLHVALPLGIAAAALVVVAALPVPWELPRLHVDRERAIVVAREELARLGYEPERFEIATQLSRKGSSELVGRYLRRQGSAAAARDYLRKYQPSRVAWCVQFFLRGSPQECHVDVGPDGEVLKLTCERGEDEPGRALTEEQSLEIASGYLALRGVPPASLRYAGAAEKALPKRKDQTHRWTDPAAAVGELRRFFSVGVADGSVSAYSNYLDPPEAFVREESGQTVWTQLRMILMALLGLAAVALVGRSFFDRSVAARPWSPFAARAALAVATVVALERANSWRTVWMSYDSAAPAGEHLARQALSAAGLVAAAAVGAYLLFFLFLRLVPQVFPSAPDEESLRELVRTPPWRWTFARGAFVWALAAFTLQLALHRLLALFAPDLPASPQAAVDPFSTFLPAGEALLALPGELLGWMALAVMMAAARKYAGRAATGVGVVLLVAAVASDPHEGMKTLDGFLSAAVLALVVWRAVGFNLSFFLWYAALEVVAPYLPWLPDAATPYRGQAVAVVAVFALLAAALFAGWKRRGGAVPPGAAEGSRAEA